MKYKLHFPYANRLDLLQYAIESVRDIGNIHVWADGVPPPGISGTTDHPLPFVPYTALMNLITQSSWDDDVLFIMHADGWAKPGEAARFLRFVTDEFERSQDWGAIFTRYDVLASYNMKACRVIGPWDTQFWFYNGDCDYYHRLRSSGWRQIEFGADGILHRMEPDPKVAPFKPDNGSATIKSDPLFNHIVQFRNRSGFDQAYYRFKWGGDIDKEKFQTPFQDFTAHQARLKRRGY